jgi:hypothetical protein
MAVDVKINDRAEWGADNYSVIEDATPIDLADDSGGVGQITVTAPERDDSLFHRGKALRLSDGTKGRTQGVITGSNDTNGQVTFTGLSRLSVLAVTRSAPPYTGTLGGAIRLYLSLGGIVDRVLIDATIADRPITLPGWEDDVWARLRSLGSATGFEISLVSDNIVIRPPRGRTAENMRNTGVTRTVDEGTLAQSVELFWYEKSWRPAGLAYPLGGWSEEVTPYQVDAGETLEFEVSLEPTEGEEGLGASLTSIVQPVCVDWVDRKHETSSVYSVSGVDGLPIKSKQWLDDGGKVTVSIGEDSTTLKVTIRGADSAEYAPYQIAMSAGESDRYSSLRLVGSGVFWERHKMTFLTGAPKDRAPQIIGATIANPAISSPQEAHAAALWLSGRYSSARQTIQVTTTGINRRDDNGSYRYMTMGEFNALHAGMSMRQFNAKYAGLTMRQLSDLLFAEVQDDFANQAFGNVAGARVLHDGAMYRIRNATTAPDSTSYTAEMDTLMSDFNRTHAGMTAREFNALWEGRRMADFSVKPLLTFADRGYSEFQNRAVSPRGAGFTGIQGAFRYINNRYGGTAGAYSLRSGITDGPAGITSAVRYTVSVAAGSGRGFHLAGNPEGGTPSATDYVKIEPGVPITLSTFMRASPGNKRWRMVLRWVGLSGTTPVWLGGQVGGDFTAPTSDWARPFVSATPPEGAVGFSSYVITPDSVAAGDYVDATGLMLHDGLELLPYRDGTFPRWAFTGQADTSGSRGWERSLGVSWE